MKLEAEYQTHYRASVEEGLDFLMVANPDPIFVFIVRTSYFAPEPNPPTSPPNNLPLIEQGNHHQNLPSFLLLPADAKNVHRWLPSHSLYIHFLSLEAHFSRQRLRIFLLRYIFFW